MADLEDDDLQEHRDGDRHGLQRYAVRGYLVDAERSLAAATRNLPPRDELNYHQRCLIAAAVFGVCDALDQLGTKLNMETER